MRLVIAAVVLVALLVLTTEAPAASAAVAPTVIGAPGSTHALASADIPERYRLHAGGTVYGVDSVVRRIVTTSGSPPGPQPTDFPFGANVPVWTDPKAQNRPSMAVDSTGRIYVAFDHATTATNGDVYVTWSDDGGASWVTPVPVADTPENEGNASVVITRGDRVSVFYDSDNATENKALWYAQSSDLGTSWTVHEVAYASAPFRDLRSPSFVSTGPGVVGMYGIWCIDPACEGGSSSILTLVNSDLSDAAGWRGIYFAQRPDVELFHPASAYSPANGGVLVMAMALEMSNGTAYDVTMGRMNFQSNTFWQDGFICGYACLSQEIPYPSIAVIGTRGVVGAAYRNSTALGPNWVVLANVTDNIAQWSASRDATGGLHRIDSATADEKWVRFRMNGTQAFAGYWKAGDVWSVASADGGANWELPQRVSDYALPTAIDGPRAVDVADSAGDPALVWQDDRAMNPDVYFSAFRLPKAVIAVDTIPSGLLVGVDGGPPAPAPRFFNFTTQTTHTITAITPQAGPSGVQHKFLRWDDSGTVNPRTILVTASETYTAIFGLQYYTTIATSPRSLPVVIDGIPLMAPVTFWCDAGADHTVFADSPYYTNTTGYRFDYWTDGYPQNHTVTCNGPIVLTAVYLLQFPVTLATVPEGLNITADGYTNLSPVTFWWDVNSSHDLSAPTPQDTGPHTRWVFHKWADGPTDPNRTITVAGATTYTAVYQYEYKISFGTNPMGLDLVVDGVTVTTPYSAWYAEGASIDVSAPGLQSADVGTRYSFARWGDGTTGLDVTVVADGDRTVSAVYGRQFLLTITTDAGTVSPGGWYDEMEAVSVTATPPPGSATDRYTFVGWTGDSPGPTPSGSIMMDGPKTLHANWVHEFRTDIVSTIPGGTIDVDAIPVTSPAALWWPEGSAHNLTAPASVSLGPDERCEFTSWVGGGTAELLTVASVVGPATYTASYLREFRVVVATNPAGRAVLADGLPYTAPLWLAEGSWHIFDAGASPQAGAAGSRYVFQDWESSSTTNLREVTVTSPLLLTATYETQYELTIGSPYGDPVCHGSASANGCWYPAGASAQVSVSSPFNASNGTRYALAVWSGDASGDGTRVSVTMDGPKTITASWELVPPPGPGPTGSPDTLVLAIAGAAIALGAVAAALAIVLARRSAKLRARPPGGPRTRGPS